MTTIDESIHIDAPPEAVWAFISDLERTAEWVVFTDEMLHIDSGPVGAGTMYRERGGPGPITDESEWEITQWDPPHRQVHEGDLGPMQPVLTMAVEPSNGGTRFRQRIEIRAFPGIRPLGWFLETILLRWIFRSGLRSTQQHAKRIIEAEHEGTSNRK